MKHYLVLVLVSIAFFSCKKEAGEGGTSTIRGKVYAIDYNADFSMRLDSGYSPNEDVYIIYGDHKTFDDNVNTNYDGTFEFKYLHKGNYTIYCYSKDSASAVPFGTRAILQTVEITDKRSTVEIPDLIINK